MNKVKQCYLHDIVVVLYTVVQSSGLEVWSLVLVSQEQQVRDILGGNIVTQVGLTLGLQPW